MRPQAQHAAQTPAVDQLPPAGGRRSVSDAEQARRRRWGNEWAQVNRDAADAARARRAAA